MEKEVKQTNVSGREKVYNFIVDYIQRNGYSPSVRDISIGTGLKSTSSVYAYLMKLKVLGKIDMKLNTPRTITVTGYKYMKETDRQ